MDFTVGKKCFKLSNDEQAESKQHIDALQGILAELEQQKLRPISIKIIVDTLQHLENHSVTHLRKISTNEAMITEETQYIIFLRSLVIVKAMRIPQLISDLMNDKQKHPLLKGEENDQVLKLDDLVLNKFNNLSTPVLHLAWMIVRSWELPCFPNQEESRQQVNKLKLSACKHKIFHYLNDQLYSPHVLRLAQTKYYDVIFHTVHSIISSLLQTYDICDMKDNISLEIELLVNHLLTCRSIPMEPFSTTLLNQSCCQLFNHCVNEKRPHRLSVAASLSSLNTQLNKKLLSAQDVVKHLSGARFLPYMIGLMSKNSDIAFGRDTNASTIGELIVSEECIKGTYELCISFLEFIQILVSDETYQDQSKSVLASVIYILNEIYPSYQLWIFKNQYDMRRILSLCTSIFHRVFSNLTDVESSQTIGEIETVCIIGLSQGQAYLRLLDVIISSRESIKDIVEVLDPTTEADLKKSQHLTVIRQSLIILNRLLSHSKLIQIKCELMTSQKREIGPQAKTNDEILTKNIEKALDNTRPSLIHHIFYYVYQRYDRTASCLAVSVIKRIAKKFSMSLMASLGSEADVVCEFFLKRLEDYKDDTNLSFAILDLLSTCVQHQPGLIELFLNARKDNNEAEATSDKNKLASVTILMNILEECKLRQEDAYKLLHTYLLKFLLTLWQRRHSAIHHFDKCDTFWNTLAHPLFRHVESNDTTVAESTAANTHIGDFCKQVKALNDKLNSFAFMILAREIFYTDKNTATNERQLNPMLKSVFEEMASKNILTKHSNYLRTRHQSITSTSVTNDASLNRYLAAWRDFVATCVRFEALSINATAQAQLLSDTLDCITNELRLNEALEKDRAALLSDTLLLIALKWMPENSFSDQLFRPMHDLLYLTNSCKDYLPFSALLALQATFNHYLLRQRQHLDELHAASDLILPAVELMLFSFRVYEKNIASLAHLESRLCLLSVTSLKFVIGLSRRCASLWFKFVKIDVIVQFLVTLLDKQLELDVTWALMDLLVCLGSIPQVAEYLHKSGLVNELNMMAVSTYDQSQKSTSTSPKSSFYAQLIRLNVTLLLLLGREYMNSVVEFILQDVAEVEGQRRLAQYVRTATNTNRTLLGTSGLR